MTIPIGIFNPDVPPGTSIAQPEPPPNDPIVHTPVEQPPLQTIVSIPPANSQNNFSTSPSPFPHTNSLQETSWVASNWSRCASNCKQTLSFVCKQGDIVVQEEQCILPKPSKEQNCNNEECLLGISREVWWLFGLGFACIFMMVLIVAIV